MTKAQDFVTSVASATPPDRAPAVSAAPVLPDFERDVVCLLGLVFDRVTLADATARVTASIASGRRCHLVTPNVNLMRMARGDAPFRSALLASDLSIADGMPLVWISRLLGLGLPGRVAGSDLFDAVRTGQSPDRQAFFFGATDAICTEVKRRFAREPRGMACAGTLAPGFGSVSDMSTPETLATINAARPDVLVVSISARKGLLWIARNEHRLSVPVIANLGATIHFTAGTVKRAPERWRQSGFEWLWRIGQEPKLWSRYAGDLGALATVAIRNVLPGLAVRALMSPSRSVAKRRTYVQIQLDPQGPGKIILLSGPFTGKGLGVLRAALAAANRTPEDITIRLDDGARLDAAALGLILLAYGHQKRCGLDLTIEAPRYLMRAFIRSQGCGYLLAPLSDGRLRAAPSASPRGNPGVGGPSTETAAGSSR